MASRNLHMRLRVPNTLIESINWIIAVSSPLIHLTVAEDAAAASSMVFCTAAVAERLARGLRDRAIHLTYRRKPLPQLALQCQDTADRFLAAVDRATRSSETEEVLS